jgi:predicted PolB exonuclease-like 3'-5' exonuclease
MRFYKEFSKVVKRNLREGHQVYLIDILVDMHFLDSRAINDPNHQLAQLIQQWGQNFMVFSKSGEYTGESEDIIKNLFKVLCGIMNFKLQQRGHN